MELLRIPELPKAASMAIEGLGFVVTRLRFGAWGDLGERYGKEIGAQPHQASIQYYRTPDLDA